MTDQARPPQQSPEPLLIIGQVVTLMGYCELHRNYNLFHLESRLYPSIELDQFRVYYGERGQPIGFANWAWLSAEVSDRYATGTYELAPEDWRSGPSLWFPEFIAPFGHAKRIIRDLCANIHPEVRGRSIKRRGDGSLQSIKEWRGVKVRT